MAVSRAGISERNGVPVFFAGKSNELWKKNTANYRSMVETRRIPGGNIV